MYIPGVSPTQKDCAKGSSLPLHKELGDLDEYCVPLNTCEAT